MVIFVFGMATMLFATFVFGVVVGKNMEAYPEKFSRDIPQMFINMLGWKLKASEKIEKAQGEETKKEGRNAAFNLTFYDTLGKRQERQTVAVAPEAGEEDSSSNQGQSIPAGSTKDTKTPASAAAKEQDTDRYETSTKNIKSNNIKRLPPPSASEKEKTSTTSHYSIHVVSYREKEKARNLSLKLTTLGYKPQITTVEIPSKGKWFRVVINNFKSKDQAKDAAEKLTKNIKGLHCVIVNPQ